MATIFKLGQTYKPKDTERTREIGMNGQYMVVIQENSDDKNLILLVLNSRKNFVEKSTKLYDNPEDMYDAVEIRAMDILNDEICIKDNKSGTVIYGDAIRHLGENKVIEFKPFGNDLIANVEYEIKTISGERLVGYLYSTYQPKNFYL